MAVATALVDLEDEGPRTIILCCARDGRALLGPIVERLVADGHQVEVVSDIDMHPAGLLTTLKRRGPSALYVLFDGPSLPADRLASLQTQLRTRGVPAQNVRIERTSRPGDSASPARHGPPSASPPPPRTFPAPGAPSLDRSGSQPITPAQPLPSGRGSHRLPKALGLVALVGLIGGTVAFAMGSDDVPADPSVAHAMVGDELDPKQLDPMPSEAEPSRMLDPDEAVVVDPEDDGEGGDDDEQEDDALVEDAIPPETLAMRPPLDEEGEEPLEKTKAADADAVYRALSEGKIRALDLLLIAPEPVTVWRKRSIVRKLAFADAAAHCAELDIDDVAGWRLATIGELSSLTTGRMLERGKFWSSTKADSFGHTRVVWNSQTGKMGPAPTKWRGGRVVCVRPSVRPSDTSLDVTDPE
jgi:hypothetical protein